MALSKEDKLNLTVGKDNWFFNIPENIKGKKLRTCDGPLGVREEKDYTYTYPAVCFPSPAALAASFDKGLVYDINKEIGIEASNRGISVMLTPGINIKRNTLCGRNFEYFSEDPILSGYMAKSAIRGLEESGSSSCLKHYLLNNFENTRFNISHNVDDKALNEIYLKNFMIAIKEGKPSSIMTSYNLVNGKYITESKELLDLPKEKWGFDGIYISDWGGVRDKKTALLSGLDIEMPHSNKNEELLNDLDELSDSLDRTTANITKFIKKHGYKEKPRKEVNNGRDLASYAVANSMVLLKNDDQILPIGKGEKIALIGHLAEYPCIAGYGSSQVVPIKVLNLKQRLIKYVNNISYTPGYDKDGLTNNLYLEKVKECAKGKDKVVFVLGALPYHEGEGWDRGDMKIKSGMLKALKAAREVNPNIIVLLEAGSPLEIEEVKKNSKALLLSYMGGEMMAEGEALVLSGKISPSGRLPETWPKSFKDTPIYYNYNKDIYNLYQTESIYVGYRYYDKAHKEVSYPFGYGLSYSKFVLTKPKTKVSKNKLTVKVKVKNAGNASASTPILLFVSKENSNTFRPVKELAGFEKIYLSKGEKKEVKITVPLEYLKVYDFDTKDMVLEGGEYKLQLGVSSTELTLEKSVMIKGKQLSDELRKKAPEYFDIKDNKFPLSSFKKIFNNDINPQGASKKADWNTVFVTLESLPNGKLAKDTFYKAIEEIYKGDDERIERSKRDIQYFPFRIIKTFSGLQNDEIFKLIFSIVNGE